MQDYVLATHAWQQFSVNLYPHVLTPLRDDCLCCEDVLYFTGSNTERQSSESAMSGCMAITTNDRSAWEGKTLLGANDVYDSLTLIAEAEVGDAKLLDVIFESETL